MFIEMKFFANISPIYCNLVNNLHSQNILILLSISTSIKENFVGGKNFKLGTFYQVLYTLFQYRYLHGQKEKEIGFLSFL